MPHEAADPLSPDLFAIQLRLSPVEPGTVTLGAGNHIHAAFLDLLRQSDPALAEELHAPDQRRPFTLGLLQGFDHLTEAQRTEAMARGTPMPVAPGQIYWLRVTLLDADIAASFTRAVLTNAHRLTLRLGNASFAVTRVIGAERDEAAWVGSASFATLFARNDAQRDYQFTFATPTAFSLGQKAWGKEFKVFPEPADVFGCLARQWELFAPLALRFAALGVQRRELTEWCAAQLIISQYALATRHVFGSRGFQGQVTYEVKGARTHPLARWLSPLAQLAFYVGVGYKTTMGMGQARCVTRSGPIAQERGDE